MTMKDKVALVTGGNSGIGAAAARIFAREGAKVAVAGRTLADCEKVAAEIVAAGGTAIALRVDVTVEDQVSAMVADTVAAFGRLDAAFNNAGYLGEKASVVDCTTEDWDRCFDVNVRGVWLSMKHEIPQMLAQGGGAIVNTASGLAEFASPQMAAYVAAKHAVNGLTRSAALDFGPHNIRVNALLPGATRSPMLAGHDEADDPVLADMSAKVPLRRLGAPDDQAEVAVWLCSDRAAYVSGVPLMVDGGLTVKRW